MKKVVLDISKKTSKKDRKACRDINRDFFGKKRRQKMIEKEKNNEFNYEGLV